MAGLALPAPGFDRAGDVRLAAPWVVGLPVFAAFDAGAFTEGLLMGSDGSVGWRLGLAASKAAGSVRCYTPITRPALGAGCCRVRQGCP